MTKNILLLSACKEEHPNCDEINGYKIYNTGIGKVNAAIQTTKLIMELKPYIVINFGSCGLLPRGIATDNIIPVSFVVEDLDINVIKPKGELIESIELKKFTNYGASCLTTDIFFSGHKKNSHSDFYNALLSIQEIVDMELFAIAKVCKAFGKPIYSFKWISDTGNGEDWKKNAAIGFEKFKKIFIENFL